MTAKTWILQTNPYGEMVVIDHPFAFEELELDSFENVMLELMSKHPWDDEYQYHLLHVYDDHHAPEIEEMDPEFLEYCMEFAWDDEFVVETEDPDIPPLDGVEEDDDEF